jgi:hypothetical protein
MAGPLSSDFTAALRQHCEPSPSQQQPGNQPPAHHWTPVDENAINAWIKQAMKENRGDSQKPLPN